jgi:hypothetical protein
MGAGIYAIYYVGSFPAYQKISERNLDDHFAQPIYVGKAVPKGARKGSFTFDSSRSNALRSRLGQHGASISESQNLSLDDFFYRSLVVEDIWIPLGESVLIEEFRPLWNLVVDGFGNKDPGKRRATQFKSMWDVLHPGRQFAEKLAPSNWTAQKLEERIAQALAGALPPEEELPPDQEA